MEIKKLLSLTINPLTERWELHPAANNNLVVDEEVADNIRKTFKQFLANEPESLQRLLYGMEATLLFTHVNKETNARTQYGLQMFCCDSAQRDHVHLYIWLPSDTTSYHELAPITMAELFETKHDAILVAGNDTIN